MSASPVVSVVIPNWNGRHILPRCLSALRRQRFSSFETVVVDNGSTDASREIVRRNWPEVRLLALPDNRGFAGAANVGVQHARGRYVALLNNDAVAAEDWIAEAVTSLERHPRAASIACKVLRLGEQDVIDGAGDGMTWSLKAYRRGLGEIDSGQYDREEQVFSASGTACLWRRDVLTALGLFDESFFAYYEDVDLGFRARLAGYEAWYTPLAVVYHVGSATSRPRRREFEAWALRNRWAVILRNAPAAWLRRHWLAIVLGEIMLAGRLLVSGSPRPVLRAYRDVMKNGPAWVRQRRSRRVTAAGLDPWLPLVHETLPSFRISLRRHA